MVSALNSHTCSHGLVKNQQLNSVPNPPYMLSTTPHKLHHRQGHSAPTSMKLYERSFQGPFPDMSYVNFELTNPTTVNKLLVEPTPFRGGARKKPVKKKLVKKTTKKSSSKKKSVKKKLVKKPIKKTSTKKKTLIKKKTSTKKKTLIKKKTSTKKTKKKTTKNKGGSSRK